MKKRFDEHGRSIRSPWRRLRKWRTRHRRVKTDGTLRFYNEVLGLPYQHYGLWEDSDPRDLEGLRTAQIRFADLLCDWIPDGVGSILDSGCGVGALAEELLRRGYEVEGLSPDPHQGRLFVERTGAPFHLSGFLHYEPQRQYDLVLMSESCQYVTIEYLFPALKECAPTGWFLVADYFVPVKDGTHLTRSGHRHDAFLELAERYGFVIEREADITEAVLPTLELAATFFDRFALPTLELARDHGRERHPWISALLTKLFGRKIVRELERGRASIDVDLFREKRRYLMYLFRSVPVDGLPPFDRSAMIRPGSLEHARLARRR